MRTPFDTEVLVGEGLLGLGINQLPRGSSRIVQLRTVWVFLATVGSGFQAGYRIRAVRSVPVMTTSRPALRSRST